MSFCPICGQELPDYAIDRYDCKECQADFKQQKFMFELPGNLDLSLLKYYDYVQMVQLFYKLSSASISPEEYDAEMQEKVQKINASGTPTPAQLAAEAKKQRAKQYAESLLRH